MSDSFHPVPIAWSDFPAECLCYLVPMSVVHLAAFVVGCIVLAVMARWQPGTFARRVGRFGLFMISFLLVGSVFNGLWSCLIYERFYDSANYVFGFIPFWPLTKNWVEMYDGHGQLLDVTLGLHFFWCLFAAATWILSMILYRLVRRHLPPNYRIGCAA
jgi:hypothetical protein